MKIANFEQISRGGCYVHTVLNLMGDIIVIESFFSGSLSKKILGVKAEV